MKIYNDTNTRSGELVVVGGYNQRTVRLLSCSCECGPAMYCWEEALFFRECLATVFDEEEQDVVGGTMEVLTS